MSFSNHLNDLILGATKSNAADKVSRKKSREDRWQEREDEREARRKERESEKVREEERFKEQLESAQAPPPPEEVTYRKINRQTSKRTEKRGWGKTSRSNSDDGHQVGSLTQVGFFWAVLIYVCLLKRKSNLVFNFLYAHAFLIKQDK